MNLYKKYTLFTLIFLLWFKKHYVSRYYFKKLLLCIPYISAKIYKITPTNPKIAKLTKQKMEKIKSLNFSFL